MEWNMHFVLLTRRYYTITRRYFTWVNIFREEVLEFISLATYAWSEGDLSVYFPETCCKNLTIFCYLADFGTSHLQGELQYFIGVQLDGSDHLEPLRNRLSEQTEQSSAKLVNFCHSSLWNLYLWYYGRQLVISICSTWEG